MGRSGRMTRLAMTVAAVGVATSVVAVAVTQPASISSSPVDLSALIVVGSSTNPTGAGVENFFGGKFKDPMYTGPNGDDIVYVNFFTGPLGIQQALDANADEPNAILASGWGAANASLLLLGNRPGLDQTVVVLDNDVARPNGGFGTRYPWFALIGVNPIPTPSRVPAQGAVNIGYEYDYNSDAPADVLNPVAAVNSLVAYLYTRLNQSQLDLPVNPDGTPSVTCNANTCAITASGDVLACPDARCSSPADRITAYVTTRANTTYVTYTVGELPLTRLIRDFFGDPLADLTGPLLKVLVDSAYYGNNPIPSDPSAYRPVRLLPSPADFLATLVKIPDAIRQGLGSLHSPSPSRKAATTADTAEQPEEEKTVTPTTEQTGSPTGTEHSDTSAAEEEAEPPAAAEAKTEQVKAEEAKTPVTEDAQTPDISDDSTSAQTNVVGESDQAEPGTVGTDNAGDESDAVGTERDSQTHGEPADTDDPPANSPEAGNSDSGDTQQPGEAHTPGGADTGNDTGANAA